jgi:transcription initiation factor TFIID TATA-box-binding protein
MNESQITNKNFKRNRDIEYKISNVVATVFFNLEEKLDLLKILDKIENSKYNPEIFPGLILRIEEPKATFLIFSSGKMILTGLRDIPYAKLAVNELIVQLRKANIKLKNPDIKITNIVASVDFHSFINLNKAVIDLNNVMYEPEVFPAVIYRMEDPKAVFLIFSTGKIICTKIKNKKDLVKVVYELKNQLETQNIMSDKYEPENEEELIFL